MAKTKSRQNQKSYLELAISATFDAEKTYCKYLAANDTAKTGGHQSGILVTKNAESVMRVCDMREVPNRVGKPKILDRFVSAKFFIDPEVEPVIRNKVRFVYYESKGEFRITCIPHIDEELAGALFVLVQKSLDEYQVFFLDNGDDRHFLNVFGLSPSDTDAVINEKTLSPQEQQLIDDYIKLLDDKRVDFPDAKDIANEARLMFETIRRAMFNQISVDEKLVEWLRMEYEIFKSIEDNRYQDLVNKPFGNVRKFVYSANTVLNRRKSRAGKSLELHLQELFDQNDLDVESQVFTEEKHKPDFLFPSQKAYKQACEEVKQNGVDAAEIIKKYGIIVLAAKTSCKDRWRQILEEADLLEGNNRYLFTLQPISRDQLEGMKSKKVILVVPQKNKKKFPKDYRKDIMSLNDFILFVKKIQNRRRGQEKDDVHNGAGMDI